MTAQTTSYDSAASTVNDPALPNEDKQARFCKPDAPPNGGRSAWLQVMGGFCLFFNSWGLTNTFGVFQTHYSTVLLQESGESTISWIGSLSTFLIAASPLLFGPIFDLGYPRLLVCSGSLLVVLGLMMTSLCTKFWQLILAQGVCVGLGGGCLFITAIAIIPSYFTTKRAIAIGLGAAGSSIAGVIYPIVFHEVQPKIGFGWAVRVIGFIALATLTVPCFVIKQRNPPSGTRRVFDLSCLKDSVFDLFNVGSLFGFMGQYIPFFYIELYASSHGLSQSLSFYMLPIMSAGSILGRIIPSVIADRSGRPLLVLSCCTLCASILSYCWIAIGSSTAGLIIFCLLYGFFSGAIVSLQPPSVTKLTTDFSKIGTKLGVNAFCGALGVLIGSPSAGAIERRSWAGMQVFAGTALMLSSFFVVATKITFTRRIVRS